jgi:rfaE bifunctional protein kinase chain/domain
LLGLRAGADILKKVSQSERLKRIVDGFANVTITVVGDIVADEFIFGEISRVSREAPVLILKHRERTIVPGGGGNAINNLAELGVKVLPVGLVGDDEPGRLLLQFFRKRRIATGAIFVRKGYTTITKTRILAGMTHSSRQQVVRVDREPDPVELLEHGEYLHSIRSYLSASDALLLSDYGYGAATPEIFEHVRKASQNLPVLLDSRYRMLDYCGVTAATPNEPEVEAALGVSIGNDNEKLASAGRALLSRMKLQSLVITRGRDGMVAFERRRPPVPIPIFGTDQVADVTGAGDTVIATFAAAMAVGADTESAVRLANYAGGVVVMKRGTATVSRQELLAAIEQDAPSGTRLK